MADPAPSPDSKRIKRVARRFGLTVGAVQIMANLGGAGICIFYFNFLDTPDLNLDLDPQAMVGAIMTLGLVAVGSFFSFRNSRGLALSYGRLSQGVEIPPGELTRVQRLILNEAFADALLSFMIWIFAAVFMGSYRLLFPVQGESVPQAFHTGLRIFIGVFVSGVATASVIFFYLDGFYRRRTPVFFPQGGASRVRRSFRLPVRRRLMYAFLLVGAGPLLVLSALFYSKLVSALGAAAYSQFAGLLYAAVFVPAIMLVTALVLAHLVSRSIADPVEELAEAMGRVERGDLTVFAPVSSNDELGSLSESFNRMLEGLRERESIKETFGRFVSKEIAGRLLSQQPTLGGEMTVVTVLFSDIRNYTTLCEDLSPKQVIGMLNGYFKHMVAAVEKNNGLVYQFVGDGIMAVFGAPAKLEDHATAAVDCALGMLAALEEFNRERSQEHPPLKIGVGINTGSVVAGIIGSEQRMEYRVVGDAVNLTARIEELNKDLGTKVLISRTTRDLLTRPFKLTPFDPLPIRGKAETVQVFAVNTA